ncbi:MAG TPA: hypothetical protein VFB30_19585, partial [Spirochaetia bacterium]|nr:hypothetical protein [Spirochaetia bacterium]
MTNVYETSVMYFHAARRNYLEKACVHSGHTVYQLPVHNRPNPWEGNLVFVSIKKRNGTIVLFN